MGKQVALLMDGEDCVGCLAGVESEWNEVALPKRIPWENMPFTMKGYGEDELPKGMRTPIEARFYRTGVVFQDNELYSLPVHVFKRLSLGEIAPPPKLVDPVVKRITDDFCTHFQSEASYSGITARMVASGGVGGLPEGVDASDLRVKRIVRRCQNRTEG